jgi:uncharacterized C2H2 Zn-finger protein
MAVICSSCGVIKEDFKELAKHIATSKKGHQKGKVWASKFLLNVRMLDRKKDKLRGRVALTDTEKESKRNSKAILSGREAEISTTCPNCGIIMVQFIPEEYVKDFDCWKSKDGVIFVNCENCRK